MKTIKKLKMVRQTGVKMFTVLVFLCLSVVAHAQLTIYPALSGMQGCQFAYTLQARVSGTSTWYTVPLYNVLVTNMTGAQVNSTVANFDCNGPIEIKITNSTPVTSAAVRPASLGITPVINGNTITFTIPSSKKFYVDINGNHYGGCIHILANPLEVNPPLPVPGDTNVVFIPTGTFNTNYIALKSNQTLYVQGGAAVAGVGCGGQSNVKILGRGFIYRAGYNAIDVQYASNVTIDGLIDLNHGWGGGGGCGIRFGNTTNISVSNTASFSSKTWGDGYDIMSSNGVSIDNVFIRTNDDAITFYGGGVTGNTGDCKNLSVTNSTLLPDLASSFHIGVYGDVAPTEIRNVTVSNIDIDNWSRTTYQGCIFYMVNANVRAANHQYNSVRVNDYVNARFVQMNDNYWSTYGSAPGREIDSIYYTNCSYTGPTTPFSPINGYDATRLVKNVFFKDLKNNGNYIANASTGNFSMGSYVNNIAFSTSYPSITSQLSDSSIVGNTFSYSIVASNSPTSYNATGLPAGLSINTSTGVITGAPTVVGTSSATINATNSYGTSSAPLTLTISPRLPSPWSQTDIGSTGTAGNAYYSGGTFNISGAGADIWGTSDAFHYVYQAITGDCQIIARVTGVQNTTANAKGGIMIRESLNANSAFAGVYLFPSNNAVFEYRSSTGGSVVNNNTTSTTIPYWLKLVRSGNSFTAYRSSDGVTWSQLGSAVTISMASNIYVGLPVCSKVSGTLCTATMDNISVLLPSPWNHADIGSTGATGSASLSGGTFTISGAGADIWGTADAFHYVYQPIRGDCQIIARVTGVQNTNANAKGGIMIRESLNANSTFASVYLFPSNNAAFQYRPSTGGSVANNNTTSTTTPYWLKLVRSGISFTAYRSSDGITWSQIGSAVTISMASNVYVGLPVCSLISGTICTATIDNVSVAVSVLPSPWNHADIGSTGATGSAGYNGGVFNIRGAGADIWGASDALHYMYQQISGNCDIRARVATLQNTNSNSKAGIMIRESLNANSTHALVDVTPSAGVEFIQRTTTGGSTTATANSGVTAPQWLRLVRSGATFTAYRSTDGTTWTTIGTSTITMNASVYVGMAVNSHVSGTLCTATIDSASVLRSDTIVWYKFNETTGTTASDASGNGNNGTLNGGASFVAGQTTNALSLNGSTGYVSMPSGVVSSLTDFTISAWVNINTLSTWSRVFDFGTGTSNYMFLTISSLNYPRFGIKNGGSEQQINGMSALPTGAWVNLVVTLSGNTGTLYVNGTVVATNTGITIRPSDLGSTTLNYIGRSQFSSDPYFNGLIDDFRIYRRALSSAEVSSLTNGAMKSAKFISDVESVDQSSGISLYPNPVTNTLIITAAGMKAAKVELYNTSGAMVFAKFFDGNQMQIDMSGVPSGIYIIRLNDGEKLILKKVVKK